MAAIWEEPNDNIKIIARIEDTFTRKNLPNDHPLVDEIQDFVWFELHDLCSRVNIEKLSRDTQMSAFNQISKLLTLRLMSPVQITDVSIFKNHFNFDEQLSIGIIVKLNESQVQTPEQRIIDDAIGILNR